MVRTMKITGNSILGLTYGYDEEFDVNIFHIHLIPLVLSLRKFVMDNQYAIELGIFKYRINISFYKQI